MTSTMVSRVDMNLMAWSQLYKISMLGASKEGKKEKTARKTDDEVSG